MLFFWGGGSGVGRLGVAENKSEYFPKLFLQKKRLHFFCWNFNVFRVIFATNNNNQEKKKKKKKRASRPTDLTLKICPPVKQGGVFFFFFFFLVWFFDCFFLCVALVMAIESEWWAELATIAYNPALQSLIIKFPFLFCRSLLMHIINKVFATVLSRISDLPLVKAHLHGKCHAQNTIFSSKKKCILH